jgi:hypothetical protein
MDRDGFRFAILMQIVADQQPKLAELMECIERYVSHSLLSRVLMGSEFWDASVYSGLPGVWSNQSSP